MEQVTDTKFEHRLSTKEHVASETAFSDSDLKLKYLYDKDDRISKVEILLRHRTPVMVRPKSLFVVRGKSKKIKLVYSDTVVRVFKTKGKKINYMVSILAS